MSATVEVPIEVFRNSDTTVSFEIEDVDLTGCTVEFWRKGLASDPDPAAPLYSTATTGVEVTFPTLGRCEVSIAQADVASGGGSAYHLDSVKDGHRVVLRRGPLFVVHR